MGRKPKPGNVIKARESLRVHGLEIKEWQRTPKQLLSEFCQSQKRPRPVYRKAKAGDGRFRSRVILPDEKRKTERDIVLVTAEDYETQNESEHASALLALKKVDGDRQHDRRLPEPYRTAWLDLSGGADQGASARKTKKDAKKADEEAFACEYCDKKFKKDHGLAIHVKREHAAEVAAAEKAAQEAEEQLAELSAALGATGAGAAGAAGDAGGDPKSLGESMFDFGGEPPKVAAKPAPAPSEPRTIKISSQGKFATQQERRLAGLARDEGRRVAKRRIEQHENSNPYSTVFMSEEHRAFVEGVVRAYSKQLKDSDGAKGGPAAGDDAAEFADSPSFGRLVKLGFREVDAAEALRACGEDASHEELLDWICVYAPEEYLPKGFDPRGKQMEVFSHKAASTLAACTALLLQAVTGELDETLAETGCEVSQLLDVYQRFVSAHVEGHEWPLTSAEDGVDDTGREELAQLREDELLALEAMFEGGELSSDKGLTSSASSGHQYDKHRIRLGKIEGVPGESVLELVTITKSDELAEYPNQSAVVLFWNSELNRHINAHMMVELAKHAGSARQTPQLYELWDVARTLLPDIVAKRPHFPFPDKSNWATAHPGATPASNILGDWDDESEAGDTVSSGGPRNGKKARGPRKLRDNGKALMEELERKRKSDAAYQKMQTARARLPAHDARYEILDATNTAQVVLISGETGSGKTTQVPQFILDDHIERGRGSEVNIICTQPRRLAAIGVAQRVADERCDPGLGGTVGYQIRLENKTSDRTRLTFLTTGILLRRLQGDPDLAGVTHILVDEVHERNVDTDFLLSILKSLLPRRPDLKLLLMSATMDAAVFCDYFCTRTIVKIPGFVHPVQDFFLEDVVSTLDFNLRAPADQRDMALGKLEKKLDYDLLAELVTFIHNNNTDNDGSILVFMSGAGEIGRAIGAIQRRAGGNSLQVLPLHGGLSGKDQSKVFSRAPKGQRKVVVSTNVAETSITIDDVVFVIDTGKLKETQYDPANRMSMLVETWVSRASARQRRGRAGRVRPGQCFKLYTKKRHDQYFEQSQLPEIHRVPLEQLVLQILATGLGQPLPFMNTLMEPPPSISVNEAVRLLQDVGAAFEVAKKKKGNAEADVELTPLGRHLARLPMDVRIGKMLIYGSLLQCADQVLTIAAALSVRNIFVSPPDKRDEANEAKKALLGGEGVEVTQSDHLCLLYAYEKWAECEGERERRSFAEKYFLHFQALSEMRDLRRDLRRTLEEIGFDGRSSARHEGRVLSRESVALVKSALCAGLYPNVISVLKPLQKFAETAGGAVARAPEAHQLRMMVQRQPEPHLEAAELAEADEHSALSKLAEQLKEQQAERDRSTYKGKNTNLERVFLHPSSINFHQREYNTPWMVYREKVKTSKVFIRDCSVVPTYAILMFGGDITVQHEKGIVTVDGWIKFRAQARVGVLVRELRKLLDRLLEKKIGDPRLDIASTDVLAGIKKLIVGSGFVIGS